MSSPEDRPVEQPPRHHHLLPHDRRVLPVCPVPRRHRQSPEEPQREEEEEGEGGGEGGGGEAPEEVAQGRERARVVDVEGHRHGGSAWNWK